MSASFSATPPSPTADETCSTLENARLAGVLHAANRVSIISTDIKGTIQVFNSGAEKITGYSAAEMVGKCTPECLHLPEELAKYGRELRDRLGRRVLGLEALTALVLDAGKDGYDARQWTYVRKDGGHVPMDLVVTAIYNNAGEHEGFLGVGVDVTEQNRLRSRLDTAMTSVDGAADMIFWTRVADRRVAFANQAACERLGYAREELVGMLLERVNPLRTERNWAKLVDHLSQKGRTTYEALFVRKGGGTLPVEVSVSLSQHRGESVIISIVRDISERKRIQARMERQMHLNSALASLARLLIDPADTPEGTASLLLEHALSLTESTHGLVAAVRTGPVGMEEMAVHAATNMMPGEPLTAAVHSGIFSMDQSGRYPGLWGHALNTGQAYFDNNAAAHPSARGVPSAHEPLRRILGAPAKVGSRLVGQLLLANPSRDYTDDDVAAVQALADLYALGLDQQRVQLELVRARDEAQTANRAKGEFLANMTHEVRTPLNGVLGMLQVLEGSGLTDEQREYTSIALGSAEHLARLLNNVLEFARLENAFAGNQQDCTTFPPTDLLQSLGAVYEPQARAKGLAFSTVAAATLPELMDADPVLVRQALVHLLDNAIKFTVAGEVRLEAACGLTEQDVGAPQTAMVFRVVDTGIGVPQAMRQRVFDAFVQVDASTTRQYGGAGLGLAIANRLASLLRGSLRLEDNPGGGTVMILTLPTHCPPVTR